MPPLDPRFAKLPTKEDRLAFTPMKKIDQADARVAQHDPPLLELAQVTLERLRQLTKVTAREPTAVVRGLLPDRGDRFVLGQRFLGRANSFEQRLQLGNKSTLLATKAAPASPAFMFFSVTSFRERPLTLSIWARNHSETEHD